MAERCTLGYFLAERRLVYRKKFHRRYDKCSSRKHETSFEDATISKSRMLENGIQTETSEDQHVRSSNQTIDHSTSIYFYREGCDDSAIKSDTNNSAGKNITVKEFVNGIYDNKSIVSFNKACRLHDIGTNSSFDEEKSSIFDSETPSVRNMHTRLNNVHPLNDKQQNTETCQYERNSSDKRTIPNIPISKEAQLCSVIDQTRDAQRSLRRQIRDLEDVLEIKTAEGKVQSEEMVKLNNDILQFKVTVIQEAQEFEKFVKQNADKNIKAYDSTCSQLSRIKTVTILNDLLKELDNFTKLLDIDLDTSISNLKEEILAQKNNLIALTKKREDIIRQKNTLLLSTDNTLKSALLIKSFEDKDSTKSVYFPDINRPVNPRISIVMSYNHRTKASKNKSPFHDLLSCLHVSDTVDDDSKPHRETDSKCLYEQRKKWEKLDRQYRKHSENMRKRLESLSDKSKKYASPTENMEEKSTGTELLAHFSLKKLKWHENFQQIKTTFKHLKQSLRDSIKRGYNNLGQLCKDITNHSVCRPTKDHALALMQDTKKRIKNLRTLLNDIFESLSKKYEPMKTTLNDYGKRIKEYFDFVCKSYTDMKRNFKQQKKPTFPNTKAYQLQIVRSPILAFLRRVKLVVKFRNVLLFDREILLPQKRFNLFEWYDLPIAVAYGIERFHQIENIFQRRLNIENNRRGDECRFDLRVYGPLEYQLGRALTYNEMLLLQEEKIAMLRNAVFKKNRKRKRKSRTHLALAELHDNTCVSCLRCLKDCVFGCHRYNNHDNNISDTDELGNESGSHVDERRDIVEDLTRPRNSKSSSNIAGRTTFGGAEDRPTGEIEYTYDRRVSLGDEYEPSKGSALML